MPKVSVLTSCYNSNAEYLKAHIESILNQTYQDFEYILLNDSPENKEIETIIKSYNDKRIIYVENEKNLGIAESRNRLFKLSKGEYIANCDHDDVSFSYRLEKEVDYLDKNPDTGVVSGNFIINFNNKSISHYPQTDYDIKTNLVVRGCVVLHPASMIRKSVLIENNIKWEKEYEPADDYRLWSRLIDKTEFYNLPEPLVVYRVHENNTTKSTYNRMLERETRIKNYLYRRYPYTAQLSSKEAWIKLFGFIPFIKKKIYGNNKKYMLFGFITLLKSIR